jgi:hypothetical protein
MTEETLTSTDSTPNPDPSTILCRIVDVNGAIQQSFQRFIESENKTLEDLANIMREEMSKIELFAPSIVDSQSKG